MVLLNTCLGRERFLDISAENDTEHSFIHAFKNIPLERADRSVARKIPTTVVARTREGYLQQGSRFDAQHPEIILAPRVALPFCRYRRSVEPSACDGDLQRVHIH